MKRLLGCILTASLLLDHLTAHGAPPKRLFNKSEFVGLVSPNVTSYEGTVLNYDLQNPSGGNIHFTSCKQVEATKENEIVESQYSLFKLLLMNCLALQRYSASVAAQRSFFPARLTKAIVAAFPATATARISDEDMVQRQGKTLAAYEKQFSVSIAGDGSAKVVTADDERAYVILARADFDNDGIEDLLVRVNWHARTAMGKGTDLFLLSKKSGSAPIIVTWRS